MRFQAGLLAIGLALALTVIALPASALPGVPPPSCPPAGQSPDQQLVRFVISVARSIGWGQPC